MAFFIGRKLTIRGINFWWMPRGGVPKNLREDRKNCRINLKRVSAGIIFKARAYISATASLMLFTFRLPRNAAPYGALIVFSEIIRDRRSIIAVGKLLFSYQKRTTTDRTAPAPRFVWSHFWHQKSPVLHRSPRRNKLPQSTNKKSQLIPQWSCVRPINKQQHERLHGGQLARTPSVVNNAPLPPPITEIIPRNPQNDLGHLRAMSSLSRAQSWPLLAGNAAVAAEASKGHVPGARVTQLQARRLLCRHYYLEGGWGWVVATCSVLVHILSHGIQLSCSQLITPASRKFQVAAIHPAGL